MYTELVHKGSGTSRQFRAWELKNGSYKILIPKGTRSWNTGITTYKYPEEAYAIMRMDAPPDGIGQPMGNDSGKLLEDLWSGKTLRSYSPPDAQTLVLGKNGSSNFVAERDRWLYINIGFPAGRSMSFDSILEVDPSATETQKPKEETLEDRAARLTVESGLYESLLAFGNCKDADDLIAKAVKYNVWPSIINLVSGAEGNSK